MSLIYNVYVDFKNAVQNYSSMLWVELDIDKLVKVTEEFGVRMKRMKTLKTLLPYINLEAKLKGFQDSLPLIQVNFCVHDVMVLVASYENL